MTSAFERMKTSRKSSIEAINEELEKVTKSTTKSIDERFWRPTRDESGNGHAVIRFLPPVDGETVPFVKMYSHSFQGPGGQWYIENCLSTIGQKDPVNEFNTRLWNTGIEADKDQARKQKRRTHYVANILVVNDPAHPENNGQVFLYKFGKKIFDKITELMNPEEDPIDPQDPVNPFDFWEGADFKLKIRQYEGYPNYDRSEFAEPTALFDGDESKLETLWGKQHKLQELVSPAEFKSYDELQRKLDRVLGLSLSQETVTETRTETPKRSVESSSVSESSFSYDEDDELEALVRLASE
jgi:hypothetical protein